MSIESESQNTHSSESSSIETRYGTITLSPSIKEAFERLNQLYRPDELTFRPNKSQFNAAENDLLDKVQAENPNTSEIGRIELLGLVHRAFGVHGGPI